MPFDANGCMCTLMTVDWIKWMYFCVNEFEVGVNDSIFSDNEQQKVLGQGLLCYQAFVVEKVSVWLKIWNISGCYTIAWKN